MSQSKEPDSLEFGFDELDFGPTSEEITAAFTPKSSRRVTQSHSFSLDYLGDDDNKSEPTKFVSDSASDGESREAPSEDGGEFFTEEFDLEDEYQDDASKALAAIDFSHQDGMQNPMEAGEQDAPTTPPTEEMAEPEEPDEGHVANETILEQTADSPVEQADDPHNSPAPKGARNKTEASNEPKRPPTKLIAIAVVGAIVIAAIVAFMMTSSSSLSGKVEYLDASSQESLSQPDVLSGEEGETLTVSARFIDGYALAEGEPKSKTVTLQKDDENVVAFTYVKSLGVTVRYVDESGADIADPHTLEEEPVGEEVTQTAPDIEGYALTSKKELSVTVSEDPSNNVITFTYAKEVAYSVRYVDSSGAEVEVDPASTGYVGQKVTCEAHDVAGYTLESEPTQTIVLSADPASNVVTFTVAEQVQEQASTATTTTTTTQSAPIVYDDVADVYLN